MAALDKAIDQVAGDPEGRATVSTAHAARELLKHCPDLSPAEQNWAAVEVCSVVIRRKALKRGPEAVRLKYAERFQRLGLRT